MKLALACVATAASLVALASPAAADPYDAAQPAVRSQGYVALTTLGGVDHTFRLGGGVEGGIRLGDSSWFARGQLASGIAATWFDEGTYQQVRAGIEARRCAGRPESLCAFAGADLAYTRDAFPHTDDVDTMPHADRGVSMIPRAGGEIGERLRLRAAVELPIYNQLTAADEPVIGLAFTLAVAYAF